MPLLTTDYISSLYTFTDIDKTLLLESYAESQEQTNVEQEKLIQGDNGIHVINVNGIRWVGKLSSPVFLMPNNFSQFENLLDLIIMGYNSEDFCLNPEDSEVTTVLKSATITIDEQGVKCNLDCWSDTGSINTWLIPSNESNYTNNIWTTRIAKPYDTQLNMQYWTHIGDEQIQSVYVISGEIKIEVDVAPHYCISTDRNVYSPFAQFLVTGYKITGRLQTAYPFALNVDIDFLESYRQKSQGKMFNLTVAGLNFDLSKGKLIMERITPNVVPGKVTTVDFEFHSSSTK